MEALGIGENSNTKRAEIEVNVGRRLRESADYQKESVLKVHTNLVVVAPQQDLTQQGFVRSGSAIALDDESAPRRFWRPSRHAKLNLPCLGDDSQ